MKDNLAQHTAGAHYTVEIKILIGLSRQVISLICWKILQRRDSIPLQNHENNVFDRI